MKELLGIRLSASSLAVFSLTTLSAMEAFAVTGEVPPGLGELIVGVAEVSSSRETNLFAYGKHINRDPRNIHPAKHVAMNIFNVTRTYTYSVAQFGFGSQVAPANPPASINFAPSDDSTTPLGQDPSPSTQSGTLAPPPVSIPAAQTVAPANIIPEAVEQSMDRACYQALPKKKCDDWCEGKSLMTMADSLILPSGSKQELCNPGLLPPSTMEEIEKSRSAYCKLYGNAPWAAEMCDTASPPMPAPVVRPRRVPSCNPVYGECPDQQNVPYWARPQPPGRQIKQCWKYQGGC